MTGRSSDAQGNHNRRVVLDSYTCDLHLNLDQAGLVGTPIAKGGFANLWAGARATHGVKSGQLYFQVQILEYLDVPHLPDEDLNPHVLRLGFSCQHTSLVLGEDELSVGYGGTGKTSSGGNYTKYGVRFSLGDVVTAFLDFQNHDAVVSFAVNQIHQGVAHKITLADLQGRALYPHILTRNCKFQANFGQKWILLPRGFEDFVPMNQMDGRNVERGPSAPERMEECQMLMMCGLPGSGKTTWVKNYCSRNPEKYFNVLGTDNIMEKMKVCTLGHHASYAEKFQALYKPAEACLETLLRRASRNKRNYILDQTNVFAKAQERKISPFQKFYCAAVVVVPSDEEYNKRLASQRRGGKIVPEKAIMDMKANFTIPSEGECFSEIFYTDMKHRKAQEQVFRYNREGNQGLTQPSARQRSEASRQVDKELVPGMSGLQTGGRNSAQRGYRGNPSNRGRGSNQNSWQESQDSSNAGWRQRNNENGFLDDTAVRRGGHNSRGRGASRGHYRGRGPQRAKSTSALHSDDFGQGSGTR